MQWVAPSEKDAPPIHSKNGFGTRDLEATITKNAAEILET